MTEVVVVVDIFIRVQKCTFRVKEFRGERVFRTGRGRKSVRGVAAGRRVSRGEIGRGKGVAIGEGE